MSASAPLLQTIEPDEPTVASASPAGRISGNVGKPVVLTPTDRAAMASTPADAEAGNPHLAMLCTVLRPIGKELREYFDR